METERIALSQQERDRLRVLHNLQQGVSVPDYATALTLTGDQQQEIGLYCGTVFATIDQPLRSCTASRYGAADHAAQPLGCSSRSRTPVDKRQLFLGWENNRRESC